MAVAAGTVPVALSVMADGRSGIGAGEALLLRRWACGRTCGYRAGGRRRKTRASDLRSLVFGRTRTCNLLVRR